MIYIYCLLFYEAWKCELETKSALRKPTRKGTDARYNFSSVHLRRRKHITTKTAKDTSIGNEMFLILKLHYLIPIALFSSRK